MRGTFLTGYGTVSFTSRTLSMEFAKTTIIIIIIIIIIINFRRQKRD